MGVRRLKLFCKFEMFNQANWYNQSNKCTMNGYFIRCKKSFLPELGRHLTFFFGGMVLAETGRLPTPDSCIDGVRFYERTNEAHKRNLVQTIVLI